MVQFLGIQKGPDIQIAIAPVKAGTILDTDGIDIAGLIANEIATARGGQCRCASQRARQFLIQCRHAAVKSRGYNVRNAQADIAAKTDGVPPRMLAIPLMAIRADRGPSIGIFVARAKRRQAPIKIKAADITAQV